MIALLRKIHIYAGLLTFSQFLIYGIAGIVGIWHGGVERPKVAESIRYVPFKAPANSSDKEVAAQVFREVRLPLARPMPDWFLRRTPEGNLLLDFYQINGIYRVVVEEQENRLRVEEIRNGISLFLSDVHAALPGDDGAPPLLRAWAFWNEAAMWSLLGFCVSGMVLWMATRPRYGWAWGLLAAGCASFAGMWVMFR